MIAITQHLTPVRLERRYETASEPIAKSHFHALWLLSRGYDIDQVANLLSFSTQWVRILVKRYDEGGPDRLADQRVNTGTEATILTADAMAALKVRLEMPPDDGGQWSGPKIARWLADFHGLKAVHDRRGWDALMAIGWSMQQPRPRHPEAAGDVERARLKKLQRAVADEKRRHPDATVEIGATDEHRVALEARLRHDGLKPITRGVWAPKGERPVAVGHHRFEWLYVTGLVEPAGGRTVWNISNAICKEMFEAILRDFAKSVGAGKKKRIVLQLDNAGWHRPENLAVPEGIRLVFQPPHSPELQPAEHLWAFVDEPLIDTHFATIEDLDRAAANRCVALMDQHDMISASALFHGWPHRRKMKSSCGDGMRCTAEQRTSSGSVSRSRRTSQHIPCLYLVDVPRSTIPNIRTSSLLKLVNPCTLQ